MRLKLILRTPLATTQRNHHQNGAGKRKDPWLRIHGEALQGDCRDQPYPPLILPVKPLLDFHGLEEMPEGIH